MRHACLAQSVHEVYVDVAVCTWAVQEYECFFFLRENRSRSISGLLLPAGTNCAFVITVLMMSALALVYKSNVSSLD